MGDWVKWFQNCFNSDINSPERTQVHLTSHFSRHRPLYADMPIHRWACRYVGRMQGCWRLVVFRIWKSNLCNAVTALTGLFLEKILPSRAANRPLRLVSLLSFAAATTADGCCTLADLHATDMLLLPSNWQEIWELKNKIHQLKNFEQTLTHAEIDRWVRALLRQDMFPEKQRWLFPGKNKCVRASRGTNTFAFFFLIKTIDRCKYRSDSIRRGEEHNVHLDLMYPAKNLEVNVHATFGTLLNRPHIHRATRQLDEALLYQTLCFAHAAAKLF